MTHSPTGARPLAGTLALVFLVSLVAAPVAATEKPAAPAPTTLAAAVAAKVESLEPAKVAAAVEPTQAPAPTTTDNRGFFKSPKGVITIVLFAAGTAYAIHATQKDRVNSPIR